MRTEEFLVVYKNVHPIALSLRQTQSTVVVLKKITYQRRNSSSLQQIVRAYYYSTDVNLYTSMCRCTHRHMHKVQKHDLSNHLAQTWTHNYIVEAHCHVIELELGEFVSNSCGIES